MPSYVDGIITRYGTGITSASISRTTPGVIANGCLAIWVFNADSTVTGIAVSVNGSAATFVDRTGVEGEATSVELWVFTGLAASTLYTATATITGGTGS